MSKFQKHDHININVPDYDKAVAFYTEVMGFEIISQFNKPEYFKIGFLKQDGVIYEIKENSTLTESVMTHIAYKSDDLQADYEFFKAQGVEFTTDGICHSDAIGDGVDYFMFKAPDGTVIEFCVML